jgi:hypothetical protein
LSGQASVGKEYYCAAFLKQLPNFNLLLIVTFDTNDVLFALFNPLFVLYIRFGKIVKVGFSQQLNLKM